MEPETVTTLFALTLIVCIAAVVIGLSVPKLRARVSSAALPFVAFVSAGAMAGSLYFSESAGYVPCELCWFQRIAMYPLAAISVLALIRRDRTILPYTLALSIAGLSVSIYHVQLQLFPDQSSFCEIINPCSATWAEAFGFATIPQMALASFALIAIVSGYTIFAGRRGRSAASGL